MDSKTQTKERFEGFRTGTEIFVKLADNLTLPDIESWLKRLQVRAAIVQIVFSRFGACAMLNCFCRVRGGFSDFEDIIVPLRQC